MSSTLPRMAHWPHATERCKARLDLDSLEPLATRLLARALLSQRLVAFVGAGVSAAYGRMAWPGLMEALWDAVNKHGGAAGPEWERIKQSLWGGKVEDFLGYHDNTVKAQVLSDVLALIDNVERDADAASHHPLALPESDLPQPLQVKTREALENFHGFVEGLLGRLPGNAFDPSNTLDETEQPEGGERQRRRESLERMARKKVEDFPRFMPGVVAVLEAYGRQQGKQPGAKGQLELGLVRALLDQSAGLDSPLRLLWHEWGIRRYITTNYDREIERGLEVAGFVETTPTTSEVWANQYEVSSFDRHSTGNALRFALEGPRRHAAVLHLHGDVRVTRSIIVTESHYQRLYLDDHPQRDLVTNATIANFAANPMLFVGSDVSEEDVLRPMREFMSGQGHRSDRMAVALFAGPKQRQERARRQAQLWVKYGVLAFDVGLATTATPLDNFDVEPMWLPRLLRLRDAHHKAVATTSTAEENVRKASSDLRAHLMLLTASRQADTAWLKGLLELQSELDRFQRAFADGDKARKEAVAGLLKLLSKGLESIEGVLCSEEPGLTLRSTLERLAEAAEDPSIAASVFDEILNVTASYASSCFLCAKLISLRRTATRVTEEDASLALPFVRGHVAAARTTAFAVVRRHGVMLSHPMWEGRFERPATLGFDEHIKDLCDEIETKTQRGFGPSGRRVVIVCAARGYGKGGQFDRLVAGDGRHLEDLLQSLQGYGDREHSRILHVNLSFSNELGPVIELVTGVMLEMIAGGGLSIGKVDDQLEMLGRALRALCAASIRGRMLLVLGNAGVLFDARGKPKNGQITRVMRALLSPRFARARLDIVMYVGESQMPEGQRIQVDDTPNSAQPPGLWPYHPPVVTLPEDARRRRRLHRLNIEANPTDRRILVHALQKTRASDLAAAYFPALSPTAGSPLDDAVARSLYFATGGSRLAQTLLLAWLETAAVVTAKARVSDLIEEACAALRVTPASSAVEACVAFVLDRWAAWHRLGQALSNPRCLPKRRRDSTPGHDDSARALAALVSPASPEAWTLAHELLWHLSAFAHPVEPCVLESCPRVIRAARALDERHPFQACSDPIAAYIAASLELLVHRCLLFRIEPRPLPKGIVTELDGIIPGHLPFRHRIRYAPHRHIQRHFGQLMGGRNLEVTAWDQFTTTIYASLPDEAPVLEPGVHKTLVEVVQRLTGYPDASARMDTVARPRIPSMVEHADRIRAAYYLVRSTYSLGVVCHLMADSYEDKSPLGHLERHRRLVRWITHEAFYWEVQYGVRRSVTDSPADEHGPEPWCTREKPSGIFFPGELVWLYNECGVISLAQGKLQDAEQLLTLAEQAARNVESDDTGSLHTRIRIHSALVQIERGRPHRARQILLPISERRNGHTVPPLLAEFYLGMIDHLGGDYDLAARRYEHALVQHPVNILPSMVRDKGPRGW